MDRLESASKKNKNVVYGFVGLILIIIFGLAFDTQDKDKRFAENNQCNVAGVSIHGELYTYVPSQSQYASENEETEITDDVTSSEKIIARIKDADMDPAIRGILVEIDSPGGSPVAGEEIALALQNATKPSVAVIRQSGMSAAYWAATGADKIFASRNSDIGSIGVTASYVQNDPDGKYIELSSGKYEDAGDPERPLSKEEHELILRDVRIIHDNFIEAVSTNRNIPKEDVDALADGSSMLGAQAKEKGLIDEIGSFKEAEGYLSSAIGKKAEVCR